MKVAVSKQKEQVLYEMNPHEHDLIAGCVTHRMRTLLERSERLGGNLPEEDPIGSELKDLREIETMLEGANKILG